MNNLMFVLVISILLNAITSIYVIRKIYFKYKKSQEIELVLKQEIVESKKITYFLKRNELFETLPLEHNSIVFIGTSLTQNFELSEYFHSLKIKNRGINGDVINGIIKRLNPIIKSNPDKIFVEIGINDLGRGASKDSVIYNYKRLINIIKTNLPETELYVQSIFPTELASKDLPTYCGAKINHDVVEINRELVKFSKINGYTVIDTHTPFLLKGYLNNKYSVDGVHLTGAGYKLWVKILKPYVNKKK
jgi:lysophospholipase L1-like esterase